MNESCPIGLIILCFMSHLFCVIEPGGGTVQIYPLCLCKMLFVSDIWLKGCHGVAFFATCLTWLWLLLPREWHLLWFPRRALLMVDVIKAALFAFCVGKTSLRLESRWWFFHYIYTNIWENNSAMECKGWITFSLLFDPVWAMLAGMTFISSPHPLSRAGFTSEKMSWIWARWMADVDFSSHWSI